jgi:phosphopantetheine--protein transferase-like protein
MIVGIGVDLVDLARFERSVSRTPRLKERLFTAAEREKPLRSLAGRFAAKEALIKALHGRHSRTCRRARNRRRAPLDEPRRWRRDGIRRGRASFARRAGPRS